MPVGIVIKPEINKWNPQAATGLINALMERYAFDPTKKGYEFIEIGIQCGFLGDPMFFWNIFISHEDNVQALATLIGTYYPEFSFIERFPPVTDFPAHNKTILFTRPKEYHWGFPYVLPADKYRGDQDPFIHLTNAMSAIQGEETIFYKLQLKNYNRQKRGMFDRIGKAMIESVQRQNNPWRIIQPNQVEKLIDEKLQHKLVRAQFTISMLTHDPSRFYVLDNVAAAVAGLSDVGAFDSNLSYTATYPTYDDYTDTNIDPFTNLKLDDYEKTLLDLLPSEVATLWHFPHDKITIGVPWAYQEDTSQCLPDTLKGIEGIHIGESCGKPVYLPVDDRTTHTMIIGKNGTGKTSLMHRMIQEDIAAGRGVCVIDPQGNLIPKILQASIPKNRLDDVVILDPSMEIDGVKYPPPINPLFRAGGEISRTILGIVDRVYGDFSGTQMEYLFDVALQTLGAEKHPTLRDVRKLYRDEDYRNSLIAQIDSLNLQDDWEDIAPEKTDKLKQDTFPLLRRINSFSGSNEAAAITCHPDPLNIYDLVQKNKIILVNLGAKGNSLTDDVRLILGSTIVAQIEAVARAGAITKAPFLLYIDEAQNFIHTPIDRMLAQVRQHGLGLILANQFLKQLTGEVQDAVEGNVGTMFSFEIGHSDARAMSHYMTTFEPEDLTSLGKFKAATSMRYQGDRQSSFLLESMLPPGHDLAPEEAAENEREARRRSVANYTPKSYDDIIKWLKGEDDPDDNSQSDDDENGDDFTEEIPES